MGGFFSMLYESGPFRYTYESFTNSNRVLSDTHSECVQPLTTAETFKDLSKYPNIVAKMGDISGKDIKLPPLKDMNEFIDDLADFIEQYIDLAKMGGKYSKMWKGYEHKEAYSLRHCEIKKYLTKIITVDNQDKTLGYFIKRFITHTTGDECGGFTFVDARENKDITSINYMHQHKKENMNQYITNYLKDIPGFVFCTEHDWDSCLNDEDSDISFHSFDKSLHKDNSAKAVYYSKSLILNEMSSEDIKTHISSTKYGDKYDTYSSKFVVFTMKNPNAKFGELFYDEVIVIGVHLKSMGTKRDITNNMEEYKFLKSVIQSFKDCNLLVVGDFNLPEFSEGQEYFKLHAEDRITYPLQDTYNDFEDKDSYIVEGLTRYSNYDTKTVSEKERTGNTGQNSQSVIGKCFKRRYNTDHTYGLFNIEVTSFSQLYPKYTKHTIPFMNGEEEDDWLSDHQASEVLFIDSVGNKYNISAYNVLSKCCSEGQPVKDTLTQEEVEDCRNESNEFISELYNMIVPLSEVAEVAEVAE
jgi:hypothetical protein